MSLLLPTPASIPTFKQRCRRAYKKFCASMPFIKRKRHEKIVNELTSQINTFANRLLMPPSPAQQARYDVVRPLSSTLSDELCLFVTFTDQRTLKSHVIDHALALQDQGISVVLIINTGLDAETITLPPALSQLHGVLVRENRGFDFAAWAHVFCLLGLPAAVQRLYLVNDSLVGPLDAAEYIAMLHAIRTVEADLVGLTENAMPRPHLQSFFLLINQRLLHSELFDRFMRGVLNLPTKRDAIECYETQLTRFFRDQGYVCRALFANSQSDSDPIDDTIFDWARLIERGCPFIKASVLKLVRDTPEAQRLIPARYRQSILSHEITNPT